MYSKDHCLWKSPWKDRLLGSFLWYTTPVGGLKKDPVPNVESSAKPPVLDLLLWHKATRTKACQQLEALMPLPLSIRYRDPWNPTLYTFAVCTVSACKNAQSLQDACCFFFFRLNFACCSQMVYMICICLLRASHHWTDTILDTTYAFTQL